MKGVIFHDKENDNAYMVHLVQGEYALCFNVSCKLDSYSPFCITEELQLISLRRLSTMSASIDVSDHLFYVCQYFGDEIVVDYYRKYAHLMECLAKR